MIDETLEQQQQQTKDVSFNINKNGWMFIILIGVAGFLAGVLVSMSISSTQGFDSNSAVDNVESLMDNSEFLASVTNNRVTSNTTLEYVIETYKLKGDRSRDILRMLVTGVCLG